MPMDEMKGRVIAPTGEGMQPDIPVEVLATLEVKNFEIKMHRGEGGLVVKNATTILKTADCPGEGLYWAGDLKLYGQDEEQLPGTRFVLVRRGDLVAETTTTWEIANRLRATQRELANIYAEFEGIKRRRDILRTALEVCERRTTGLEDRDELIASLRQDLQTQEEAYEHRIDELSARDKLVAKLRQQLEESEKSGKDTWADYGAALKELDAVRHDLEKTETRLRQRTKRVEELEDQISDRDQQITELEEQLADVRSALDGSRSYIMKRGEYIIELEKRLEDRDKHVESLGGRITGCEKALAKVTEERDAWKRDALAQQNRAQTAETLAQDLAARPGLATDQQIRNARAALKDAKNSHKATGNTLATLGASLNAMEHYLKED